MAPSGGHSVLVIPISVMPENDDSVSIVVATVPAAVPPAVMSVELGARSAIVIAIVVPVPADADAEPLGARHGRRRNRDGRQRSENARKLPHFCFSYRCCAKRKRVASRDVPGTGSELS